MLILSSIGRIATQFARNRALRRSERELRALPLEVQKDIGWPQLGDENICFGTGDPCAK